MADTNTTNSAVTPEQHTIITNAAGAQALEAALAEKQPEIINGIDPSRSPITLKGIEIIQQIDKFGDTPGEYSENGPIQGEYYRFKFQGAIFTASPEFKKAFDAQELYSVTFTPTLFGRTVPDPNNAGMKKVVQGSGWSMDKATTIADMQKARENMGKIRKLEFDIMRDEVKHEKLVEAFKATDLSKLITEDDMKAMLEDA